MPQIPATRPISAETQVVVVGGGLAGLTNAIHLAQQGIHVVLIEKHSYPRHKVCGEYISNEVLPYLSYLGVDPFAHGGVAIGRFELSTSSGKQIQADLPLGGFGISRYLLDDLLYQRALEVGVVVVQDTVTDISYLPETDRHRVPCKSGAVYAAEVILGAYGKRSSIDVSLDRVFIKQRSPYLGVKGHYRGEFPSDLVALHNFDGGYCGVSKVEEDRINICYLASVAAFKKYGTLEHFEHEVVRKNPHLEAILSSSEALFDRPLTISQVSFLPKPTVERHVLMSGDSAGMIHPLCGNGMGMAIHSGLILSEAVLAYFASSSRDRQALEQAYSSRWRQIFRKRLLAGRIFNTVFGYDRVLTLGMNALSFVPGLLPRIIKQTHGEPLEVNQPKK